MYTAIRRYYPTGLNGGQSLATLDEAYETRDEARAAGRSRWGNSSPETHGRTLIVDLDAPRWAWLREILETPEAD